MSIKLPTALDYGERPSLRSNRIDAPAKSGLILAEAVERAAGNVVNLMVEKKQKTDRLNYALAKQEMMTAESVRRQEMKNDPDYETQDERFQENVRGDFESIKEKYKLAPDDGMLIDAEGDYMVQRGRVSVGDAAYGKEM